MTIGEIVGKRAAERMRSLRLTQEDVAEAAALSQPTISAILRGETKNPSIRVVAALARALRMSVDELTDVGVSVTVASEPPSESPATRRAAQIAELQDHVQRLERDLRERTKDLSVTTKTANMALKLVRQLQGEIKSARRQRSA